MLEIQEASQEVFQFPIQNNGYQRMQSQDMEDLCSPVHFFSKKKENIPQFDGAGEEESPREFSGLPKKRKRKTRRASQKRIKSASSVNDFSGFLGRHSQLPSWVLVPNLSSPISHSSQEEAFFPQSFQKMWSPRYQASLEEPCLSFFQDPPIPLSPSELPFASEALSKDLASPNHSKQYPEKDDLLREFSADAQEEVLPGEKNVALEDHFFDPDEDFASAINSDIEEIIHQSVSQPRFWRNLPQDEFDYLPQHNCEKEGTIVYQYSVKPPSITYLLDTLPNHGLPTCVYEPPFFGNPLDVPPRSFVFGGKALKPKSKDPADLLPFESSFSAPEKSPPTANLYLSY